MKALILNSGLGRRMGVLTSEHPKCMTEITASDTILSIQLKQLVDIGVTEVVMTTGLFDEVLVNYCRSLDLPLEYHFVNNPRYAETNYIYSIYCARDKLKNDDILLMHGDLVFENSVIDKVIASEQSCMTVSSTLPLPEKDFKAVIKDGRIAAVGISFFDDAVAAQPLYLLKKDDWNLWLNQIIAFCEAGETSCYAENAFNEISDKCRIMPLDVKGSLCNEIDTPEDLSVVSSRFREIENRKVYMCFSTDIIHSAHIGIIKKASRLGKLTVGVLSDEVVTSYKRFPLLPCEERKVLFQNINGVSRVIEQKALDYSDVIKEMQPDIIVHGDDWRTGFQKPIRDEVVRLLATYGGRLVEFPYSTDPKYVELEKRALSNLSIPDVRRGRLRKAIDMKGCINAIEAHSGLTGLIAALIGQGLTVADAAVAGVYLHGMAGELAAGGSVGMAASELLLKLPEARKH